MRRPIRLPAAFVSAMLLAEAPVPPAQLPPAPATPRPAPRPNAVCPVDGAWAGHAMDQAGTAWDMPMRVRQVGTVIDITIEWRGSNGHVGDELAHGTIDCASRRLEFETVHVNGGLAPGRYHAVLEADGRTMAGSWDGPMVIPGTWSAAR